MVLWKNDENDEEKNENYDVKIEVVADLW